MFGPDFLTTWNKFDARFKVLALRMMGSFQTHFHFVIFHSDWWKKLKKSAVYR